MAGEYAAVQAEIARAVAAAVSYDPKQPNLQREAYTYLEQIKATHAGDNSVWQACLALFVDKAAGWQPEARMFGLQVVDEMLSANPDQASLMTVQNGLIEFVKREYVSGEAEGNLFYLRNKLVHTLFLVFMRTYTSTWPDFFSSFVSLLPSSSSGSSSDPYNPQTTDLLLRLLHEVSVEISDTTLRLNKAHARLTRDTELRDAFRVKDAAIIADAVQKILEYAVSRTKSPSQAVQHAKAVELAEMSMRVLADYASWIDISLIVTPTFLPVMFECLTLPYTSVKLASADLMYELVTKGMPPSDKLELLRILNASEAITQLLDSDDSRRASSSSSSGANGHGNGFKRENGSTGNDEGSELFREKLARLLNGMGLELTKIVDEASATEEQKEAAKTSALALRPLALRFLADEYDDTSATVIPFFSSILGIYKKEKKRTPQNQNHMTQEKTEFLNRLLEVTIGKMRFSSEEEWGADDDDEDGDDEAVTAFAEFRKNLKTIFDAVAWIDFGLFSGDIKDMLFRTLDSVDSGSTGSLAWNDVELVLHVLYLYGEPAQKETGTAGVAAFVQVPPEVVKKTRTAPDSRVDYTTYPPSALGEMMLRTIQSRVASWPHPSVPLQLFECVCRYHDFFTLVPDTITTVLPCFLDERGMHQAKQSIRSRCFYLFNRFISTSRPQLQANANVGADAVADICTRVQDLLVVEASLPASDGASPGEDLLARAAGRGSPFDSQLYLFEALGTLISLLYPKHAEQQVSMLSALLEPLLSQIQAAANAPNSDLESLLLLSRLIKAVGNTAYGFPELKNPASTPEGQWVGVLQEAMRVILGCLKAKSQIAIIREASLGAFKSVAARIGEAALPLVAPLIDCLVSHLTAPEMLEFLSFIGMLTHRYKTAFGEMLDMLLAPVLERVYHYLEMPITGTDDIQLHSELRRAYFNLMLSIASAGMSSVFFSERNVPRLENLLNSIPHYLANNSLLPDLKVGFGVINRLGQEWIKPATASEASALPQFKDFVYERVVPLGMELPVRQNFDYSDAAAYQVIGEIATLYKTLQLQRGEEFTSYLSTRVFPTLGMPPGPANEFLAALTSASDGKIFKKWLAPFFQNAKKGSNDKPYSVAHLLTAVPSASAGA